MRRFITLVVLIALVVGMTAPAAHAGSAAANAALGLASFAVFNQIVAPFLFPRPVYAYPAYAPYPRPVVVAPVPVYAPPPVVVVAPRPAVIYRRVAPYPYGRYVVRGGAMHTAYPRVWVPGAP